MLRFLTAWTGPIWPPGWGNAGPALWAGNASRQCSGSAISNPDWLFIGEGPGAEDQGEPFVGQAGKLLDNMLAALGIARGRKVYIGNAVKRRPPGNRTPEAAEIGRLPPVAGTPDRLAQTESHRSSRQGRRAFGAA